jgi:hypothetical protein
MKLAVSLALVAASAGRAFADPHVALTQGPLPGAPGLLVVDRANPTHCGGRDVTVRRRGHGDGGEPELVIAMTIDAPRGLDFGPAHEKASQKKLLAWITDATKKVAAARAMYLARFEDAHASAADRVAASARIVQLERRFADVIGHIEIPLSMRTGDYAADTSAVFCDAAAEKADAVYDAADTAATACRKAAADGNVGPGWWDTACAP